jgi:hypothetical protein
MKIKNLVTTAYLQLGLCVASAGLAFGSLKFGRYLMQCSGGG